jgi:hypothetical protein
VADPFTTSPPPWVAVVLALFAAVLSITRMYGYDFWFHLGAGRSIATQGLPAQEQWCLAAAGEAPWLSEWLFHLGLFGTFDLAGFLGVTLWRAAWVAVAVLLVLVLVRNLGAWRWSTVALIPLLLAVAIPRMLPRPEQLFLAFALFYLVLFEETRRQGGRAILWLIPVQIFWANVHASWIIGPVIALAYAVNEGLGGRNDPLRRSRGLRWLGLAALLAAASAISPQPLESLSLPFRLFREAGGDPFIASITELAGYSWSQHGGDPFTVLWMLAAVAALLGAKRAWRASPPLVVAALASIAIALLAYRFRALSAFLCFPVIAVALSQAVGGWRRWVHIVAILAACVAGVAMLVRDPRGERGIDPVMKLYPVRATAMADTLDLDGPVLNSWHYGGYILWVRGDEHPPLADGRHLGSWEFRSRYARSHGYAAALDSLIAEWEFTHAIVERSQTASDRLPDLLFQHPRYALVFHDDSGLLYVDRERYPAIADRLGYRFFAPENEAFARVIFEAFNDSSYMATVEAEVERARRESPGHVRATMWLGLIRSMQQRYREAIELLEETERLAPDTDGLAFRLGFAYESTGDLTRAKRYYRRALDDPDDAAMARQRLEAMNP